MGGCFWAELWCFGGTRLILVPGLSVPEVGGTVILRNTDKTDQFHRSNSKSACRRVGPLVLGPNFGISCYILLHLMLKLEVAVLSQTSAAKSVLTRSKATKWNQHEHLIAMNRRVSRVYLLVLWVVVWQISTEFLFVFDSKAMQHPSKPTEYGIHKCH
jgi:hypothetical protein